MTSALADARSAQCTQTVPALSDRPPMIKAVCLDIDDTLVDFTSSARNALRQLIGRDDMWQLWERLTDEHVARAIAGEMDSQTMRCERTKAFLADLGALLDDDVVAVLEQRRLVTLRDGFQLYDDVLPCLDWLRAAGLRIAAVTNATGNHQRGKLAALGLSRFFDEVVIAGEVGVAKPDPVIFHTACTLLDVSPAEAIHVGDRLDLDAVGAVDSGLHAVWLDRSGLVDPVVPAGVHILDSLAHLPELLVGDYLLPTGGELAHTPSQPT